MTATLSPIEVAGGVILGDEVHARIGAAILDGTLSPGQRLRDVDLALQLGVSRTPVREALQRLERFGLVEVAVGRYTRVSTPDDRVREETGEFTAYLMGNALRIALQRCTDAQHSTIVELMDAVVDSAHRGWQPFLAGPIARADSFTRLREHIVARDADRAEQTLRFLHGVA